MLTDQETQWLADLSQSLDDTKAIIEKATHGTMTDQDKLDAVAQIYKLRSDLTILGGIIQRRL